MASIIAALKRYLKRRLSPRQRERAEKLLARFSPFLCLLFSSNLRALSELQRTDKGGRHRYIQHYERHFCRLRRRRLNIFEIGVGGYDDPASGGNSLRMWKHYFRRSMIYSMDIYDKSPLEENRIKIFRGSQDDQELLRRIHREAGRFDIIIDDGSHLNEHVIRTFEILFPLLEMGGIYVIEDVQTSYWPDHGGDSDNLGNPKTTMNFLKSLSDCLNHEELIRPGYAPTYYDRHIVAMHFYHNLVFIYKGMNNEGSNFIKNNSLPADTRYEG